MSSAILIECLLICCSYVYNLGDAFQNCLIFYWGDAFGPGYSGLAAARLLLRNEPSPAYPYRGFFI